MNVTLEDAYAEACRALGESIVRERLVSVEVQRLSGEVEAANARTQEAIDAGREAVTIARA